MVRIYIIRLPTIYNMIADLDYDNREVEFEEFLAAIIDKLGDKVKY